MKTKRGLLRGFGCLIVAVSILWWVPRAFAEDGVIRIGITHHIMDPMMFAIGQLMVDEFNKVNAAGGINGHKIEVFHLNDECKPEKGVANVNRFIHEDHVHLVIGSGCSSVTLPMVDIVTKEGVPLLNAESTNDKITEKGSAWVFRVAVPSRFYTGMRAKYMVEHAGKKVAYLYTNDSAAIAFAHDLIHYMRDTYHVDPIFNAQMQESDLDFRAALLKIKALEPDALAVAGTGEALARLLQQSYEVGIPKKVMRVGPPSADEISTPILAGSAAVGLVYAGSYSYLEDRPAAQKFRQMVRRTYGLSEPNFALATTYDTVQIAILALQRADLKLTADSLAADRIAIRNALESIHDYRGVLGGPISFCAAPTPQCRDGEASALLLTYTKGGDNFAVKVLGRETMPRDTGVDLAD